MWQHKTQRPDIVLASDCRAGKRQGQEGRAPNGPKREQREEGVLQPAEGRQTRPNQTDQTNPKTPPPKRTDTVLASALLERRNLTLPDSTKRRQTKKMCVCPVLHWWKKFHRPGQTGPGRNPLPRSAHTMPPGGPEGQLEPPQSTPEGGRGRYVQNVWPQHKQQENEKQESESRRPD